jgi:hypothetical protein
MIRSEDVESRIVWIFGSPRSGSTWLFRLLARLTGGAQIGEPLIGAHLGLSVGGMIGLPVPGDPLLSDTMTERPAYFFADDAARAWVAPLRTLLVERFRLDAERHEAEPGRVADPILVKEPWGSVGAPVLLRALPQSRLLFLVRDGRDVVDSLLDAAADGWLTSYLGANIDTSTMRERAVRENASMWVRSVEAVQRAYDAHPPALRLLVTYEELLAATDAEVRRIITWLGRDDALDRVEEVVELLAFANFPEQAKGPGKFPRAATPGLWRERIPADEQAVLEEIMRPSLDHFGYA